MSTAYCNKVQIQRNTPVLNDYGDEVPSWSNLKLVSGKFTEQTARETAVAGAISYVQTAQFETWGKNVEDVTELDRVVYRGKNWNIYSLQRFPERNQTFIQVEMTDDNG